jgi:hypothetical protein
VSAKRREARSAIEIDWKGPWLIHFFEGRSARGRAVTVPARDFLDRVPTKVAATMMAVLDAVAAAPPPAFSGGGKWEAMHGDMTGFYEVRVDGPKRRHYRLFCLLARQGADVGLGGPSIVILCGKDKAFRTKLTQADYDEVRELAEELRAHIPWSVAT